MAVNMTTRTLTTTGEVLAPTSGDHVAGSSFKAWVTAGTIRLAGTEADLDVAGRHHVWTVDDTIPAMDLAPGEQVWARADTGTADVQVTEQGV